MICFKSLYVTYTLSVLMPMIRMSSSGVKPHSPNPLKKLKFKPAPKAEIIDYNSSDSDPDESSPRIMVKKNKSAKRGGGVNLKTKKKCKKTEDDMILMDPSLGKNLEKVLTEEEKEMMCLDLMLEKEDSSMPVMMGGDHAPSLQCPSSSLRVQAESLPIKTAALLPCSELQTPIPLCHNIVSTSQIISSIQEIDLQRLASLFPFTSYDRKRFAAITIRLANPHCTCLLFGSGKLVITGSTSFHACIVASQTITEMLREVNPRDTFEVASCVIQNIVAHVELKPNQQINLEALYMKYCEHSTYQKTIFPGLVLRPPESPIVLLIFKSGRIVCTGGKSYNDIYHGFTNMFKVLRNYIFDT